jgi:hypothetical protein
LSFVSVKLRVKVKVRVMVRFMSRIWFRSVGWLEFRVSDMVRFRFRVRAGVMV